MSLRFVYLVVIISCLQLLLTINNDQNTYYMLFIRRLFYLLLCRRISALFSMWILDAESPNELEIYRRENVVEISTWH